MQNEKIKDKETVMIPVPAELLLEAGITIVKTVPLQIPTVTVTARAALVIITAMKAR